MIVKSRGVVLHRFPYSDSSLIVKVLTEECGVVSFIVKGGKRSSSPFKGAVDPLSLVEVVFNQKQRADSDLQFIKEATLLNWHGALRGDLLSMATAQVMAEILLRYAPQGVPLQDEFTLISQALDALDQAPSSNAPPASLGQSSAPQPSSVPQTNLGQSRAPQPSSARDFVFSKWLLDICDLWGYHLDLDICSRCERPLTEPAADFHPETGGLICRYCLGVETPRAKPQTLAGLWMLRHPQPQTGFAREFVENALLAYLRNHIGFLKEIHSLQYLQEIRKLC